MQTETQPYRILVVDDNEASAKTMGWSVEAFGHEVKLAHHASHAFEIARSFLPDIILLDISLPDIDGFEVCRTLKKDIRLQNTVFIAQTGWGEPEDRQRTQEAGFDYHLVKPIHLQDIEQTINSISLQRPAQLYKKAG